MDLRKAFFSNLIEMARENKNLILMTGDLGYSFIEEYQKEFEPKGQYLNCGVAEQNMIGVASGLALAGKKPYVYSGALFLVLKAMEQIRSACYQDINVKFIGTGHSGFLGFTHNLEGTENLEDLLKNLPLKRYYPKDEKELKKAMFKKERSFIKL